MTRMITAGVRLLGLSSLLGLASACFSGAGMTADTATPRKGPQVLGHAGSGFFTPINPFNPMPPSSLGGILNALSSGAEGVEVDVQLSQDSVPMLYHDRQLGSITNGQGCISQHTAAEIMQLRYQGGWPYDWFQNERPVPFDTLLARLGRGPRQPYLHLDLHEDDQCAPAGHTNDRVPALVRALGRSLRRYHLAPERVLAVTMRPSTVPLLRAAMPRVPVGLEITDNFEPGLRAAQALRVQSVVLDADRVTPEQAARAHALGFGVVIFGGRSGPDIERLLACHPDAIEVDNVHRLLVLLGR